MTTLQVADALPRSRADDQSKISSEITMTVSPEMLAVIEQLGRGSGQSLERAFEQAIALYRAALNAHLDGKHVGLARSSDAWDVEFTGFLGD